MPYEFDATYEGVRCPSIFSDLGEEYQCVKEKGHLKKDPNDWHKDQYENTWNKHLPKEDS